MSEISAGSHVLSDLPRFVVGRLPEPRLSALRAHLDRCLHCSLRATYLARRFDALREELAPVASFERILTVSLRELATEGQLEALTTKVAAHLAIAEEQAGDLLRAITRGEVSWQSGPRAGISVLPIACGLGGVQGFAIRIEPGVTYPMHRHDGAEHLFILQGGLVDHDGAQIWRGDGATFAAGTAHASTAIDGHACILVTVSSGTTILEP